MVVGKSITVRIRPPVDLASDRPVPTGRVLGALRNVSQLALSNPLETLPNINPANPNLVALNLDQLADMRNQQIDRFVALAQPVDYTHYTQGGQLNPIPNPDLFEPLPLQHIISQVKAQPHLKNPYDLRWGQIRRLYKTLVGLPPTLDRFSTLIRGALITYNRYGQEVGYVRLGHDPKVTIGVEGDNGIGGEDSGPNGPEDEACVNCGSARDASAQSQEEMIRLWQKVLDHHRIPDRAFRLATVKIQGFDVTQYLRAKSGAVAGDTVMVNLADVTGIEGRQDMIRVHSHTINILHILARFGNPGAVRALLSILRNNEGELEPMTLVGLTQNLKSIPEALEAFAAKVESDAREKIIVSLLLLIDVVPQAQAVRKRLAAKITLPRTEKLRVRAERGDHTAIFELHEMSTADQNHMAAVTLRGIDPTSYIYDLSLWENRDNRTDEAMGILIAYGNARALAGVVDVLTRAKSVHKVVGAIFILKNAVIYGSKDAARKLLDFYNSINRDDPLFKQVASVILELMSRGRDALGAIHDILRSAIPEEEDPESIFYEETPPKPKAGVQGVFLESRKGIQTSNTLARLEAFKIQSILDALDPQAFQFQQEKAVILGDHQALQERARAELLQLAAAQKSTGIVIEGLASEGAIKSSKDPLSILDSIDPIATTRGVYPADRAEAAALRIGAIIGDLRTLEGRAAFLLQRLERIANECDD